MLLSAEHKSMLSRLPRMTSPTQVSNLLINLRLILAMLQNSRKSSVTVARSRYTDRPGGIVGVSCACSLFRPHCSGCPFPSPHLKVMGSATQRQARDRDSRAAKDNLRTRGIFGKPVQEGVPGLQRGPKAKLPRPTIQSSETIVTSQLWFG